MSNKMKLSFDEESPTLETGILLDGIQDGKECRSASNGDVNIGNMNFIRRTRLYRNGGSTIDSSKLSEKHFIASERTPKGLAEIPRFIPCGKNVSSPIEFDNVRHHHKRFLSDFFTTCIDAKWRWISVLFSSSFILSWLFFGTLWWLIFYLRKKYGSTAKCIDNVDSWVGAFLFSLETQSTIGYGGRQVTPECPEGVMLLVIQTIVGLFITCSTLGLTFAKLSRPKNRANTVVFSKTAVITLRDSKLCLMVRIADIRRRRLYDCNVRAVLIHSKITKEGELIPFNMSDLSLSIDLKQTEYTMRIFPIFPINLIHPIDEDSPLYEFSGLDLAKNHVEVVVILEGTVPHTGMVTQAVTSYTSKEIKWGHRFTDMLNGKCFIDDVWRVDFSQFHNTYKDNVTPMISARELSLIDDESDSNGYQTGSSTASAISSFHGATLAVPDSVIIEIDSNHFSTIPALKETEA
eukprot:Seg3653.2 transcript_id=Seg3653.2/GoldUCD/mRNA.D3Y31 product="Inward rectifier potassium channel 2" protein_id=Seg3653.2/GoldUCD/D3Y31